MCVCRAGYEGDGVINCTGQFTHQRYTVFSSNGTCYTCTADINECLTNTDDCDECAFCTNTEGSFECNCQPGLIGDGRVCTGRFTTCTVQLFEKRSRQLTVADIDECADCIDDCGKHATCTNTKGSFECTCNKGYTGDGKTCRG